jgi:hypothetical protein
MEGIDLAVLIGKKGTARSINFINNDFFFSSFHVAFVIWRFLRVSGSGIRKKMYVVVG